MKTLAILGASGHGGVVAEIAELCGYTSIYFFDDSKVGYLRHWKIEGNLTNLTNRLNEFDGIAVAIGNNSVREGKVNSLEALGAHIPSLIHPKAIVSHYATIGAASVICAGAVIGPFSTVGRGCIINTSSTIDHDCVIKEFAHVSPGANLAGGVIIGRRSWVGISASIIQLVTVGDDTIIGANSTVLKHIPSNVTAVGQPAKIKK